ncbi:MAG TPA: lasso peptide biosynthesis B2 protein [Terriglobales bacterium]|jgi:hypothetical protein
MGYLVLNAYWKLIWFGCVLTTGNFARLYRTVGTFPVTARATDGREVEWVCRAIDTACLWYWKEVLCLQRSAATTCLLRQRGIDAQMVLGAQQTPFKAHAWVEVAGQVVNDKPYMAEIYAVLDRC